MLILLNKFQEVDTIIEGQFENNILNGHARVIWSSGDYYEGQFHNNQIIG